MRGLRSVGAARPPSLLFLALGLVAALLLLPAAPAGAAVGPRLLTAGEFGAGAGEMNLGGGGVVADPTTGHLFVSELNNHRISEFTPWGEFVKAWGWGVADGSTAALQVCSANCFRGLSGSGVGQLQFPNGIAIAPSGELYVFERSNNRVQVFDQSGQFVRMFGGGVNSSTSADVCSKADVGGGAVCGAGVFGDDPGEFSVPTIVGTRGDYIDIAASGTVYVGDQSRIQEFAADGTFVKALALPEAGSPGALALDPVSGDVYFSYAIGVDPTKAYRLQAGTGAVVYQLQTTAVQGIAVTADGTTFVSDDPAPANDLINPVLRELDGSGKVIDTVDTEDPEGVELPSLGAGVVTNGGESDLYVLHSAPGRDISYLEVRGVAPDKWPPPSVPPTIEAQFATEVGRETAVVKAEINPNFWADTRYYVEYGTAPCAGGGCLKSALPPGDLLGAGIVRRLVTTAGVEIEGLAPATTYHYRFVAVSGGGGPVFGAGEAEEEATFRTYPEPALPPEDCPNQGYRTGASAALWECRAFELVSPIDKAGGDIAVQGNINSAPARLDQATPDGGKITYSSYRSFADSASAGYTSQYIGSRGSAGWQTQPISPPREGSMVNPSRGLDSQFKAFLPDLSRGWLNFDTEPLLAPGAAPGYINLYRRNNTSGGYEALTVQAPASTVPDDYNIEIQGYSADGSQAVFRANGKLTPNASSAAIYQLYESVGGALRLVSVKPAGSAATADSSAGTRAGVFQNGRENNVSHAISDDGTKIYWTEGTDKIYLRVEGAVTLPVSAGPATFWTATPDGDKALYVEGGKLQLYELSSEASTTLVGEGVQGVLGASEDLSRIYFGSTAALAPGAQAGQTNLYLYEHSQPLEFVATLAKSDNGKDVSPLATSPLRHLGRVTPDGSVAVFMSRSPLTGADNLDQGSGEQDAEVFRFDASTGSLLCISCNPTGARPQGRDMKINGNKVGYWYASRIATWEMQMHAPRVVSTDGKRVFFDSFNPIVASDQNGKQDVYEWEAPGRGECLVSDPTYLGAAGGCVRLISGGVDGRDSEFVDASANGRDVFFLTGESLVDQDPGQVDLYDAREDGGFPPPPPAEPECDGESCQPLSPPPAAVPPNSSERLGEGNPAPRKPKPCRKGFVKKKGKCVKKGKRKKGKGGRAKKGGGRSGVRSGAA